VRVARWLLLSALPSTIFICLMLFAAWASRDGSRILSWSEDKTRRLWDAATGSLIGPAVSQANRCGARTGSGAPCKSAPVTGRRRCRMHGGADGSGAIRNGNYKHGRYTEDVAATRFWLRQAAHMLRDLNKRP
jgi:hypothetical protein